MVSYEEFLIGVSDLAMYQPPADKRDISIDHMSIAIEYKAHRLQMTKVQR